MREEELIALLEHLGFSLDLVNRADITYEIVSENFNRDRIEDISYECNNVIASEKTVSRVDLKRYRSGLLGVSKEGSGKVWKTHLDGNAGAYISRLV